MILENPVDTASRVMPGKSVQHGAYAYMASTLADLGLGEIGSGDVYDTTTYRAVEYLVAGGGPTVRLVFLLDSRGIPVSGHVHYSESGIPALMAVPGHKVGALYQAYRKASGGAE